MPNRHEAGRTINPRAYLFGRPNWVSGDLWISSRRMSPVRGRNALLVAASSPMHLASGWERLAGGGGDATEYDLGRCLCVFLRGHSERSFWGSPWPTATLKMHHPQKTGSRLGALVHRNRSKSHAAQRTLLVLACPWIGGMCRRRRRLARFPIPDALAELCPRTLRTPKTVLSFSGC